MTTGLRHLHSYLAYAVLAALIITVIVAVYQLLNKRSFSESLRKTALVAFIFAHLQLLFGILLYLTSPLGISGFSGEAMQDSVSRLYVLEHPLTMLLAIILITIGYIRAKRPGDDVRRYRTLILFYTLGLVLILLRIPWMVWP